MSGLLLNTDDELETSSLDSDDSPYNGPQLYDEPCSTIVHKLLRLNGQLFLFYTDKAIFVPTSLFDEYKTTCLKQGISISDEHIWDYELRIGDTIRPTKLIWMVGLKGAPIPIHRHVNYAFNFLQPDYLRYMDKPFWNPDAITQVNLILDYHRAQERRGIEIFNICDLIKFKMAIDDNRFDYENCEFHKIIDRTLRKIIEGGMYIKDDKFDLNKYLGDRFVFRNVQEIFEYLVYHFQKTIDSIYWSAYIPYPVKLSNITNIPEFMENFHAAGTMLVREIDPSGKCSEVLYEILSKSKNFIGLKFELDDYWVYSGVDIINEITEPLAKCEITIETKNSFNFIENFINWLKFTFGSRSKDFIELRLKMFETFNPFVLNGFHLAELEIRNVELGYKLIKMCKNCKAGSIYFINCRITNDLNMRYEFIGRRSQDEQNIFKFFDELQNVGFIKLELEEHTIGTLFAHVASIMRTNKLAEFQFTNQIWIPNEYKLLFIRSGENTDFDRIDAYSRRTGDRIDFYEVINRLSIKPSDREEFDFYE